MNYPLRPQKSANYFFLRESNECNVERSPRCACDASINDAPTSRKIDDAK